MYGLGRRACTRSDESMLMVDLKSSCPESIRTKAFGNLWKDRLYSRDLVAQCNERPMFLMTIPISHAF
jgi:hypothetical protein